ncbi:MAG: short-subunit dehydrogenase [Alteromonadaceae bacterium]
MSDIKSFNNKVFIITGASEGIGCALAKQLANQCIKKDATDNKANSQLKLVLAARNEQRLQTLKQQLIEQGLDAGNILLVPTDVSVEQDCQQLIDKTVNQFGQIDYLINNAGITMWSAFEDLTDLSVFNKIYQVNVMGAVYLSYYALPHLKKAQGTIVAVASLAGLTGVPSRSAYAASKHAMVGFFDSLRIEQKDNNINVITIAPDFVVSQIHKRALDKNGNALEHSPMQEKKIMSSEDCGLFIINAIKRNKRLAITSLRGKMGMFLKLFFPSFIDTLAAKAIRQRH